MILCKTITIRNLDQFLNVITIMNTGELLTQVRDSNASYMCCTEDGLKVVRSVEDKLGKFKVWRIRLINENRILISLLTQLLTYLN